MANDIIGMTSDTIAMTNKSLPHCRGFSIKPASIKLAKTDKTP